MYANTSGSYNVALGYNSLWGNETGGDNVAIGDSAMVDGVSATNNVALGLYALRRTDSGWNNVAIGTNALSGPTGYVEENIAIGRNSQTSTAMSGDENISLGAFSLDELTSANGNVAIGDSAGTSITSGDFNTVVGTYACCGASATGSYNVLFGYSTGVSLTSGSSNILIGDNVGTLLSTGSNNILIGQEVRAQSGTTSNQLNIGNLLYGTGLGTSITLGTGNIGIGSTAPGQKLDVVGSARFSAVGSGAYASDLNLTADGTLTTSASDVRLKENLVELGDSEVLSKILLLKPYTFNWIDGGRGDIGLIAQDVAEVFPEIIFTNKNDGYMGVNYSRLPSLLVSAIQEQQDLIADLSVETQKNSELVTVEDFLTKYTALTDTVWTFISEVIFKAKVTFLASVEFVKKVTFGGEVQFNNDTVGRFVVPAGVRRVAVNFDTSFTQVPTVYLSALSGVEGGYNLESVSTTGFILEFESAQVSDRAFDWLAVLGSRKNNAEVTILEETDTVSVQDSEPAGEVAGETIEVTEQENDSTQIPEATESGQESSPSAQVVE